MHPSPFELVSTATPEQKMHWGIKQDLILHCVVFIQAYLTSNKSKLMAIAKLTCTPMNGLKINANSLICKQCCPENEVFSPTLLPSPEMHRALLQGQVSEWLALAAPLSPSVLIGRMERTTAVLQTSPCAWGRPCEARDHACVLNTLHPTPPLGPTHHRVE